MGIGVAMELLLVDPQLLLLRKCLPAIVHFTLPKWKGSVSPQLAKVYTPGCGAGGAGGAEQQVHQLYVDSLLGGRAGGA